MPRVCKFTGKKTTFGNQITIRGKAKYLGGVGTKITGITARTFKPNIQKVRAVIDGQIVRVKVSAKAIRNGAIVKPVKRTWKKAEAAAEREHRKQLFEAHDPVVGFLLRGALSLESAGAKRYNRRHVRR